MIIFSSEKIGDSTSLVIKAILHATRQVQPWRHAYHRFDLLGSATVLELNPRA